MESPFANSLWCSRFKSVTRSKRLVARWKRMRKYWRGMRETELQRRLQRASLGLALAGFLVVMRPVKAQDRFFAGVAGGVCALSADGQTTIQPPRLESSSYKPENGPMLNPYFGLHLNDYLSVQVDYFWNRNDLRLSSLRSNGGGMLFYDQLRTSTQHSVLGELLLYFRKRSSRVRPYLSVGTGAVRLMSKAEGPTVASAGVAVPPTRFSDTTLALHVSVGIDLFIHNGWAFRYSFGETMTPNAISRELTPPGTRGLADFRNLFGFAKYF